MKNAKLTTKIHKFLMADKFKIKDLEKLFAFIKI